MRTDVVSTLADRMIRTALVVVYAGTAFVGLLAQPPVVLLAGGATCAAAAAGMWALLHVACTDRWPAHRHLVGLAVAGAAVPAFAGGAELLGDTGGLVTVIVMLLVVAAGGRWLVRLPGGDGGSPLPGPPPRVAAGVHAGAKLRAVPLHVLLDDWDATGRALLGGPASRERLVLAMVRERLLDELTRRDPDGVAVWLSYGPDGPPRRYLRDDEDLAS
jgi:hypothetical protein